MQLKAALCFTLHCVQERLRALNIIWHKQLNVLARYKWKDVFDRRRHFLHHGLYSKETQHKIRRNKLLLFVLAVFSSEKNIFSYGKADGSSQLSDSRWTDEVNTLSMSLAELYTAGTMNLS